MPLFSDHITNMYYSGSPSYSSLPYSYSSATSPFGTSYSATYLNPGGNYSSHSSLGGYSRVPLSSRWLTSGGRAYSPMLSTISEKGSSSPVRINSPRRIPISGRSYVSSPYSSRPININTADIDVSRDKYRNKVESSNSITPTGLPPRRESSLVNKENEHDKPDTGIDTSPGSKRTTIKRDRTVVRLHTVKRKERDSPRKPVDVSNNDTNDDIRKAEIVEKQTESKKWREKLADDLAYKTQKEKKTLGAKLVEKFTLKEKVDDEYDNSTRNSPKNHADKEKSPLKQKSDDVISFSNKSVDRRCSMELLAEQASLLDSLIRRENLSTAPLDLSKIGAESITTEINLESEHIKKRKLSNQENRLVTTKSDHSLHERLLSKDAKDPIFPKRKSLRKCSSSGNLRKLDCIKEISKKATTFNLPSAEEFALSTEQKNVKEEKINHHENTVIKSLEESADTNIGNTLKLKNKNVEKSKDENKILNIRKNKVEQKTNATKHIDCTELKDIPLVKGTEIKDNNLVTEKVLTGVKLSSPGKEISKKTTTFNLPPMENSELLTKNKNFKPKMKTKITSTVEVTTPTPQLKFIVENVTVEEKSRPCKKDIIFSSTVDEKPFDISSNEIIESSKLNMKSKKPQTPQVDNIDIHVVSTREKITHNIENDKDFSNDITQSTKGHRKSLKSKTIEKSKEEFETTSNLSSPEPEDGNFWEKIGKRETVYLIKRKKNLDEAKEQNKRTLFWFPEAEEHINTDINSKEETTKHQENAIVKSSELTDANIKENKLTNKNSEMSTPKEKNETKEKRDLIKDINCKELKDIADVRGHHDHITEIKDNVLGKGNLLTLSSLGNEICELKMSKISEPHNDSNRAQRINGKLKEVNKIKQEIEFTNKEEGIMGCMIASNQSDNLLKETKDDKKLNDNQKTYHRESLKKIEEKSCNNIPLLEAKLTNSEEISKNKHEMESFNCPNHLELTQGPVDKNKLEKISTITGQEVKKNSPKQDSNSYVTTNAIKMKDETIVTAVVNTPENLNNHENKIIESSEINKSLNKTNTMNSNIDKKKAKKQNLSSHSSNTSEEVNAADDDICIKTEREDMMELINQSTNNPPNEFPNIANTQKVQQEIKTGDIEANDEKYNKDTNNESRKTNNTDIEITRVKSKVKNKLVPVRPSDVDNIFANMKPAKEEKAPKPLIATPRPLQKRNPQTIRSSSSSESSEDDSSDEDTEEDGDEEDASGSSQGSTEFLESENNPDGRTSTGSNDSGFDSSAPTSPSGFLHAKKDCDVNCHRKCEKLTANLCGVNQRLLVEALASRTTSKRGGDSPGTSTGTALPQTFTHDILEQELEHSTAYDLFRKTGRFTPPARSIPRFRKYTIEDFQFIRVLGKGSFGKVMLAELRDTEYYYAVKCLKKDVVLEDDDVECTLIERKVLALGTNHPYLCHLFATFQTDSHLFFVMEYLNGGDLMFHIQQSGRFQEVRARFYAAEIVSGLKFLHKRGIVYRDLKLDNILLDFDGHVRIADFGMCKLQIYLDKTADTFCGTPDYMAPEIIKGLKYNQTVDWWSFGVLLYEMLIGQSPFSGCDEDELFWSICNEMPSYPRFLSKESLSILTRLLDKDAKSRLGGPECMHGDIRDQEFFEPIQWDRLERRELEAPFKPRVRHPMDTQYFDRAFTGERPRLTAVEPQVLRSMDQEPFRGFSYTNPNATDR